jgi:hypothetical protein
VLDWALVCQAGATDALDAGEASTGFEAQNGATVARYEFKRITQISHNNLSIATSLKNLAGWCRNRSRSDSQIVGYRFGFRRRTPAPPPFSAMNSTPAFFKAFAIARIASSDTRMPSSASARFTVGTDSPAAVATSVCDHPMSARAARICEELNKMLDPFGSVCMIPLYQIF